VLGLFKKMPFWANLLVALAIGFLLILSLTYYLDFYTRHGRVTEVPDVTRKNVNEAVKTLRAKGFKVVVDSTYRDSLPKLMVIKQAPEGGEKVKAGRTINLVVNKSSVPLVVMPNLLGASVNSALHLLDRANLRLQDTLYKPDFAVGRVLQQLLNGNDIKAGDQVPYGSKITMIIGSGLGAVIKDYPDFWGMTLKQAIARLNELGLSLGAVIPDPGTKDSLNALVWKQYPPRVDEFNHTVTVVRQGNAIDLWISPSQKERETDSLTNIIDRDALEAAKEKEKTEKGSGKPVTPSKPADKKPDSKPAPTPAAPAKKDDY
jgi:eukaryotic-like serine/threonine-protein kinase